MKFFVKVLVLEPGEFLKYRQLSRGVLMPLSDRVGEGSLIVLDMGA